MNRIVLSSLALLLGSSLATAQTKAPGPGAPAPTTAPTTAPAVDWTKVGPMSRPVTKQKEDKQGIDQLVKAMEDAGKKGDINAAADLVDFPISMISDDSKGNVIVVDGVGRDRWISMMKPYFGPTPKDVKMTMKHDIVLLSDTLGYLIGDTTMNVGKTKGSFKSVSMVVQKDGKWKFKSMSESGWADVMSTGGAAKTPPAPKPGK